VIVRELKLKLTKVQETTLSNWFWSLTAIYNFGIRKIELNAENKIYFSKQDLQNLLADHSKKLGIPSHTIQATLLQAYTAWDRCFKKLAKKPKLKSIRNKMRSITFPDILARARLKDKTVNLPGVGSLRYFKQDIPEGKIKLAKIVRKASGWYCQLTLDTKHVFKVQETLKAVGIDTGFKHLAILSDGTKIENQRNYVRGQVRLAQAQRGNDKKLSARLQERIANRRKDHNHKVSRTIVENYKEIYITNDNLRGQAAIFGKSVSDAGISQLRSFLLYKGDHHGRVVKLVDSKNTTLTCGSCGSRCGPRGLSGLAVRVWECSACGAVLDRDINAANVILKLGLGYSLASTKGIYQWKI